MTGPADTAAVDIAAFCNAWDRAAASDTTLGDIIAGGPTPDDPLLTVGQLRAVLDEREQLAARVAELEAEREADTQAVNDLLAALDMVTSRLHIGTLVKVELLRNCFADRIAALGQQDNAARPCVCGCPRPGIDDMCCCPEPCPCSPCGYCDDPAEGSA